MLSGRKPLAVFCDEVTVLPNEDIIPEERFRPYVDEGRFVREEAILDAGFDGRLGRNALIKYVLFAQRAEAWRIPAFLLLKKVFYRTGRNPQELERMECHLLGYTEEEVEAWCNHAYRKPDA